MIKESKLTCPECREEHQAGNKEKSFQQNPYILAQIGKVKLDVQVPDPTASDICPEHDKELVLFCEEKGCKKPICVSCLTKEHKRHDVVEINDKKKALLKDIEAKKEDLIRKMATLCQAQDDVQKKTVKTVNELKKTMQEMSRRLGNMIKEAEKKMNDTIMHIETDVSIVKKNIQLLDQMRDNIIAEREATIVCLTDGQETLAEIENNITANICRMKKYKYLTFHANKEINCGKFEEGLITVVLSKNRSEASVTPPVPIPITARPCELKWKGNPLWVQFFSPSCLY